MFLKIILVSGNAVSVSYW